MFSKTQKRPHFLYIYIYIEVHEFKLEFKLWFVILSTHKNRLANHIVLLDFEFCNTSLYYRFRCKRGCLLSSTESDRKGVGLNIPLVFSTQYGYIQRNRKEITFLGINCYIPRCLYIYIQIRFQIISSSIYIQAMIYIDQTGAWTMATIQQRFFNKKES